MYFVVVFFHDSDGRYRFSEEVSILNLILGLKNFAYLFIVVFALFWECSGTAVVPDIVLEVPFSTLANYKMKILPETPTAGVAVSLAIFEDCAYNKLSIVQRNGSVINIEKQFNSRMMLPCLLRNDTIQLGVLPRGTYLVVYKLVDLATENKPKTSFALSFKLPVL